MLTGDQRVTAEAIGRELGLLEADQTVLDGRELERDDGAAVTATIARAAAFSRVTPEHKIVVVRALQARRRNRRDDRRRRQRRAGAASRRTSASRWAGAAPTSPSRRRRSCSPTIASTRSARPSKKGRVIFDNIRKFVFYLFSCNVAEVLVLLGAGLAGLPLPLLPLQLLWLNS